MNKPMKQRADLTFKHNVTRHRHGWLRLTPAYSIKLVDELLDANRHFTCVLEPFSGTGTTGLACGERGIACDLLDINPFLVWFAGVKTRNYTKVEIAATRDAVDQICTDVGRGIVPWFPPIHDIDRWWNSESRDLLGELHTLVSAHQGSTRDLLSVAFCRCAIEWSNAAFNHQSMSFKEAKPEAELFPQRDIKIEQFRREMTWVLEGAATPVPGNVTVRLMDSRETQVHLDYYDALITSPPYPNRMSYIRELRPYMYWLGYLTTARQAGELDWQAIGGTWGCATSLVGKWQPNGTVVPHVGFAEIIAGIHGRSPLLANYVHKYFDDMVHHIRSIFTQMKAGGEVFYIVGNSKYYDTVVPVEEIFASLMRDAGFERAVVTKIRKRNSKKELYEFVVSARKPTKQTIKKRPA